MSSAQSQVLPSSRWSSQRAALKKLGVKLISQAEASERWKHRVPAEIPSETAEYFDQELKSGAYKIIEFSNDEIPAGICIYRVHGTGNSQELVVAGAYSSSRLLDWTAYLSDFLSKVAAGLGCSSIRFHTSRPGLVMKAINHGFEIKELVLTKKV